MNTPAARPNSVALARATTSSSSAKESTVITGPKISSRTIAMSSRQPSKTVGATKKPLRERAVRRPARRRPEPWRLPCGRARCSRAPCPCAPPRSARRPASSGRADRRSSCARRAATSLSRNAPSTAVVHEDARAVRADLAGRIEIGEQRAGDRVVEVGVVEDDQRRLAAELERDVLQRRAPRRPSPPCRCRPRRSATPWRCPDGA